jgi:hypothetical protein
MRLRYLVLATDKTCEENKQVQQSLQMFGMIMI